MALPLNGTISLNDIHIEAGGATGDECTLNDADIRALLSPTPASGSEMDFSDWYGASASTTIQLYLEAGRGGGGNLSGSTFGGKGGSTVIDMEISGNKFMSLTAGGQGQDGFAATQGGGGGGGSNVQGNENNFGINLACAGGGGGGGYSNFQGGNAGRGGDGAGTYQQVTSTQPPVYTYSDASRAFAIYPANSGWGEADTTNPSGPSGGSSYPGKGGQGGGQGNSNSGGLGGTGRYAGQTATTSTWGQGGWSPATGGRGGENSAANSNAAGGSGSFGGAFGGGIGGNAVSASDSGGGGGGGGTSGGGGGSGGAYGSGAGGGGAGYYLNTSGYTPINVLSLTRVGGATGARNASGRVRVYREGVLVNTTTSANATYTALY